MCCYRLIRWETETLNKLFINNQTICSSIQRRYQSLQYERIRKGDFAVCLSFLHNHMLFLPREFRPTLGINNGMACCAPVSFVGGLLINPHSIDHLVF